MHGAAWQVYFIFKSFLLWNPRPVCQRMQLVLIAEVLLCIANEAISANINLIRYVISSSMCSCVDCHTLVPPLLHHCPYSN